MRTRTRGGAQAARIRAATSFGLGNASLPSFEPQFVASDARYPRPRTSKAPIVGGVWFATTTACGNDASTARATSANLRLRRAVSRVVVAARRRGARPDAGRALVAAGHVLRRRRVALAVDAVVHVDHRVRLDADVGQDLADAREAVHERPARERLEARLVEPPAALAARAEERAAERACGKRDASKTV